MIGSKSKQIKSRFHDLPPKSMSKYKRRNAYAKQQKRHVSMTKWASISIVESK